MKILYAGSPEASAETLKILLENQKSCGFEIAGVLTNPPSSQGRHKELIPTPVEDLARENNIPVFSPEHLDSACREQILPLGCELLVSFAYGHIFGPKFLAMFRYGGINLHPSFLPKYRGCTPIPEALKNRDESSGVTIQTLDLKMDEGDILSQEEIQLTGNETAGSLLFDAARKGAVLIYELLESVSKNGKVPEGKPQSGEASYTGIIRKSDGEIDWSKPASEIDAKIRAYTPDPGCFTKCGNDIIRILSATYFDELSSELTLDASLLSSYESLPVGKVFHTNPVFGIDIKCGKGYLRVTELQKPGKKAMSAKDFLNGARDFNGKV